MKESVIGDQGVGASLEEGFGREAPGADLSWDLAS